MHPSSTIIIPAHNEADYIGACLRGLLNQDAKAGAMRVIVAANACTDAMLWKELPFLKSGAVGAGLFALNAAARSRWGHFPEIISDNIFVRLNFTPDERIEVPCPYYWPMVEGFSDLVKARRRKDADVIEVRALYPQLLANDNSTPMSKRQLAWLALRHPWPFAVYASITVAVKSKRPSRDWVRGR